MNLLETVMLQYSGTQQTDIQHKLNTNSLITCIYQIIALEQKMLHIITDVKIVRILTESRLIYFTMTKSMCGIYPRYHTIFDIYFTTIYDLINIFYYFYFILV